MHARTIGVVLGFLVAGAAQASGQSQGPAATGDSLHDAFADVNGVHLHYRIGGQGPAVVLLHGLGATSDWWSSLVPDLLAEHTVIVPDLRGHGLSTNPGGTFRVPDVATDVLQLLDQLGIREFSGIGHSAGAGAFLHMAAREPDRVSAMIIIGLGHRVTDAARARWSAVTLASLGAKTQRYYLEHHPGGIAQAEQLAGYLRHIADSVQDLNLPREMIARIKARTLIVFGDRDSHPVEIATELYRMLPNAQLWIVPRTGHFPFWPEWGGSPSAAAEFPGVASAFLTTAGGSRGAVNGPGTGTAAVAAQRSDADAVRQVLANSARGLEQHDWAIYSGVWANDSDISVVHPGGREWVDGWDAVAGKYRAFVADTSVHLSSVNVRQDVHVSPHGEFAWVAQQDTLHFVRAGRASTVLQWSTAVLEKRRGEWKLVHAHASQLTPRP